MNERKPPSPDDIKQAFIAYEAAVSPLILAIALGLLGQYLDTHYKFTAGLGMETGAVIGFISGLFRLFNYLKSKP